uniref:Uncharacterized protein n=1 Tax=Megaviridae environmental sample TaxID=1737588 RepID=A0A5J6VIL5_9VIRU|nr:MAG: hypothetical protein [Megaviridae environmental sample]
MEDKYHKYKQKYLELQACLGDITQEETNYINFNLLNMKEKTPTYNINPNFITYIYNKFDPSTKTIIKSLAGDIKVTRPEFDMIVEELLKSNLLEETHNILKNTNNQNLIYYELSGGIILTDMNTLAKKITDTNTVEQFSKILTDINKENTIKNFRDTVKKFSNVVSKMETKNTIEKFSNVVSKMESENIVEKFNQVLTDINNGKIINNFSKTIKDAKSIMQSIQIFIYLLIIGICIYIYKTLKKKN